MIKITLPFPPTVNSMFQGGSKQRRYPSKAYKQWLSDCPQLEPLGLLYVEIEYQFWFPDKRERDSQNYVKAVTDYLVKQNVIVGDSWELIRLETIRPMGVDRINNRVDILINGLGNV